MNTRFILTAILLASVVPAIAAADEITSNRIDFENDLIPVFTKSGCNAGACHGAAVGRGGFRLSLYGGDPRADYESIVRQLEGRRVNLRDPDQSLIVLKPTQSIEHDGGLIIDEDSEAAGLIVDWIKQGAEFRSRRDLNSVEITPEKYVARSPGETVPLQATALFSDGTMRDVTRWTIFTAEDTSAVRIDPDSAQSTLLRRGRHVVVARYLDKVVPIEFIVPLNDATVDLSNEPRHNFIDDEILDSLETLGLPVSPVVDDAAFRRRVTLDLTGRLPRTADTHLAASEVEAGKPVPLPLDRQALVDQLLSGDEFNEYWTLKFAKLLRIRPQRGNGQRDGGPGARAYHNWLARQIQEAVSYRTLVRTMITASGDTHENGPANFYRTVAGPREQAEFMSELFMGSRLRCANCHNHPLDRWTQDDYHGLAAIFAKVDAGQIVKPKPSGAVIHPRTLEKAASRIPGEAFLPAGTADPREELADWLTDHENPYFAKAIVNRLWKSMMGRGLVEPVDDFRATNPATHPGLLEKLADDFRANGYNVRHTLRRIALSAAYARSADALPDNRDDDQFYSHAARRPLEPEVLADAITDVLGVSESYGNLPRGTRAVALRDAKTPSRSLDVLGRCVRDVSCETTANAAGGLTQKLHLFNGALLNARIAAEGSRLGTLDSSGQPPLEIINEFYRAALHRSPSDREREHWKEELATVQSAEDRQAFLEDFVWGLMTCNEFVTNH